MRTHQQPRVSTAVFAASAIVLASAPAAYGQFALGGGDALDANPSRVTGRSNIPARIPDYRARNLVVTGDVAAGREFRGDVGYRADTDFRGGLGSDDTFRFRADTVFSSPSVINTLPSQFRFGEQLGVIEYRRAGVVTAPTAVPTPRGLGTDFDLTEAGPIVDRIRLDQLTRIAAAPERHMLDGDTRTVGTVFDQEGRPYFIEASPLRGIGYTPAVERYRTQGMTMLDRMRLQEDLARGRMDTFGVPREWRFEQLAEPPTTPQMRDMSPDRRLPDFAPTDPRDDRRPMDGTQTRLDPRDPSFDLDPRERDRIAMAPPDHRAAPAREQDIRHREIIERIARRYANAEDVDLQIDPQVLRELDEEFAMLRDRLARRGTADEPIELAADPWARPEDEVDPEAVDEQRVAERPDAAPVPGLRIDPEQAVPLLRHGQRVERLTGVERTRFNELMEMAEQNLRDGEFFLAERQFIRALHFHPGEPLATAGMAHAQMGAGLYIASSLSLQRLFTTNPEMIDVRYEPGLLPSRARLTQVVDTLQGRLGERRDRASTAFLLAYIGHQLQDRELVEQGLAVFRQVRPADDMLYALLHGIWLGESER